MSARGPERGGRLPRQTRFRRGADPARPRPAPVLTRPDRRQGLAVSTIRSSMLSGAKPREDIRNVCTYVEEELEIITWQTSLIKAAVPTRPYYFSR